MEFLVLSMVDKSAGCINETMRNRNLTTLESNGTIKLVIKPIYEYSKRGQNMVNVHGKGGVLLSGNKTIYISRLYGMWNDTVSHTAYDIRANT